MSSTPSSEKTQAQANAGMVEGSKDGDGERKSSTGSETQGDGRSARPSEFIAAEASVRGTSENAIDDAPVKDEDEPDYSPPGASPVYDNAFETQETEAAQKSPAMTGSVKPEVASVLAQLAQYTDRARSQSAGSAG